MCAYHKTVYTIQRPKTNQWVSISFVACRPDVYFSIPLWKHIQFLGLNTILIASEFAVSIEVKRQKKYGRQLEPKGTASWPYGLEEANKPSKTNNSEYWLFCVKVKAMFTHSHFVFLSDHLSAHTRVHGVSVGAALQTLHRRWILLCKHLPYQILETTSTIELEHCAADEIWNAFAWWCARNVAHAAFLQHKKLAASRSEQGIFWCSENKVSIWAEMAVRSTVMDRPTERGTAIEAGGKKKSIDYIHDHLLINSLDGNDFGRVRCWWV